MIKAKPLPHFTFDDICCLLERVDERPHPNGCWIIENVPENEYSKFKRNGQEYLGHRVSHHVFKGEVTPDRVVDHLCRNRACINPQHLRLVSQRQNSRANHTKCRAGHPYTRPNLIEVGRKRKCMACELKKLAQEKPQRGLKLGGFCPQGHELTFENVYQYHVNGNWTVLCAPCQRQRANKYFDAKPLPPMTSKQIRAFTSMIEHADSGCWIWTGMLKKGYGRYVIDGKNYPVHRIMYQLELGKIQQGFHLDHLCGNKACCNPGHLEPVPPAVNSARGKARRKANPRRRKTWRNTQKPAPFPVPDGHLTVQELAEKLGETPGKIHRMIARRNLPSYKRNNVRYIPWADYVEWRKIRDVSLPAIEPDLTLFP